MTHEANQWGQRPLTVEADYAELVGIDVAVDDRRVAVDGRVIYTAKDLKVGLFADTSKF